MVARDDDVFIFTEICSGDFLETRQVGFACKCWEGWKFGNGAVGIEMSEELEIKICQQFVVRSHCEAYCEACLFRHQWILKEQWLHP